MHVDERDVFEIGGLLEEFDGRRVQTFEQTQFRHLSKANRDDLSAGLGHSLGIARLLSLGRCAETRL